jgi:hypothetical protein
MNGFELNKLNYEFKILQDFITKGRFFMITLNISWNLLINLTYSWLFNLKSHLNVKTIKELKIKLLNSKIFFLIIKQRNNFM